MAVGQLQEVPVSEKIGLMQAKNFESEPNGDTKDPVETEMDGTAAKENNGPYSRDQNEAESPYVQYESAAISIESPIRTQESTVNGGRNRTKSTSSTSSSPNRSGMRSTSSKFARLKAAFEQGPSVVTAIDGVKRRHVSSERSNDGFNERKKEYEAQIGQLKDELEKEKELRVAFEEKVTSLEEDVDDLNSRLEKVTSLEEEIDDLKTQLEEREGEHEETITQMKVEAESQLDMMASEARSREDEISNLQKQLSDLKRSVSTSTRTSPQVSDSTFREEFELLQHEVQNWVVNNFRRAKIEVSADELCTKIEKVTEPQQLEQLLPIYEAFDSLVKLPIFQATVACYMMEIFDEPFLFGLQGQRDWGKRLKQAAEGLRSVLDAGVYNRWRASTFDALRQAEGIKEPVESAATGISEMICIALIAITEAEDSEARLNSLKAIIHRAISLAHLIRVQQAQYHFVLPASGGGFDAITMDDISDHVDTEIERTVRCATFPAIIKLKDEDGEELDERNVVAKAKVLCNHSDP